MNEIWAYIESLSRDKAEFSHARKAVEYGQASKEQVVLGLLKFLTERNDQITKMLMRAMELNLGPVVMHADTTAEDTRDG